MLRWCPDCVRQDIEDVGEPIWHVAHQLPGVLVCTRHKTWLAAGCGRCGWQPYPSWAMGYPPVRCANGHVIASRRPGHEDVLSVSGELVLANWSNELLAWRPGGETRWMGHALRQLAVQAGVLQRRGWRFNRSTTTGLARNLRGHPVLRNWSVVLARVTRALMDTPMDVIECVLARRKVHPLAIALCVKALVDPHVDVLSVLRQTGAGDVDDPWRARWYAVNHFATADHVALMHELIAAERDHLAALGVQQGTELLGSRLGVSYDGIRYWLSGHPELRMAFHAARSVAPGAE
jgi:hypothetical protein